MQIESTFLRNKKINFIKNDSIIGDLFKKGIYWDETYLELYKKYRIANKNILDIGGFIGTNSLLFSELIEDENVFIYTFEPQFHECLEKNIQDNNLQNKIILLKCGLANYNAFIESTEIDFNSETNFAGKSLLYLHDNNIESQLKNNNDNDANIEIRKLDYFEIQNIGLIKIDVEGMELQVLQGGIETLKKNNFPPIFIEIWEADNWRHNYKEYYENNAKEIKNFLESLGYKQEWNSGHDYIYIHG